MDARYSLPDSGPWSPVGYNVVEVANEGIALPPKAGEGANADRQPFSPVGYRVVKVAEERGPGRPRPTPSPVLWKGPRREPSPRLPVWGPVLGGLCALVLLTAATIAALPRSSPPRRSVSFVPAVREVNIPREVQIPDLAPAELPGGVNNPIQGDHREVHLLAPWDAALNLLAAEPAAEKADEDELQPAVPAGADCNAELAAPAAERETFGTAVAFARNFAVAAQTARHEHKLVFLLHVSGNFEEARFT